MSRTVDFNRDNILSSAMEVFWNKGFEGTTIKDLMEATGLLKGSLYNSFQSKENLFLLCLEKYGLESKKAHYREGDPKEYLKLFFRKLVDQGVNKNYTKGCLIMNSCLEFTDKNSLLSKRSEILFSATESNFRNVVKLIYANEKSDEEIENITIALITSAFSIREISKFRKNKKFLTEIANKALSEVDMKI